MKFTWTPEHSIGIKIFDDEHQQYFVIANKIYDLLDSSEPNRDLLLSEVSALTNYALYHLASEEVAFYKYNFPGTKAHVMAHNALRQKISDYLNICHLPETDLVSEVREMVDFASNWLVAHISSTDKLYTEFFANKEI